MFDEQELRRFIDQASDEILGIVSKYVSLKRSGSNYFGLCPLHDEKTPSFSVNEARKIYKCFGCGRGGRIVDFIMNVENLDFPESIAFLSKRIGIAMPRTVGRRHRERQKQKKSLADVVRSASRYYRATLLNSPDAENARKYLFYNRCVTDKTIFDWDLGYTPESWGFLLTHLQRKGFSDSLIELSGLAKKSKKTQRPFDFFFDEGITFTIRDRLGRPVAVARRRLDSKKEMKYLNISETPLYKKRKVLYGLYESLEPKKETRTNEVIVTEGYFDVLISHQQGIRNVVAPCGTALTPEQAFELRKHFENAVVAFDPDSQGMLAAVRAARMLKKFGLQTRVLCLPGKDLDETVLEEGAKAVTSRISSALPLYGFELEKVLKEIEKQGQNPKILLPDEKEKVVEKLVPFLEESSGPGELHLYINETAGRLGLDYATVQELFYQYRREQAKMPVEISPAVQSEYDALVAGFKSAAREHIKQNLSGNFFTETTRKACFEYLKSMDEIEVLSQDSISIPENLPEEIINFCRERGIEVKKEKVYELVNHIRHTDAVNIDFASAVNSLVKEKLLNDLNELEDIVRAEADKGNLEAAYELAQVYEGQYSAFIDRFSVL